MNSPKKRLVVGVGGIDPRDVRLIEIVFRHSQYNAIQFELQACLDLDATDILLVNPMNPEGLRTLARLRAGGQDVPVVSVVPRNASPGSRYAIALERLTLQLLPTLNRVIEDQFDREGYRLPESTMSAFAAATRRRLQALHAEAAQQGSRPVAEPVSDGSAEAEALAAFVLFETDNDVVARLAPVPQAGAREPAVPAFLAQAAPEHRSGNLIDGLPDALAFRLNRRVRAAVPRVLVVDDSILVRGQLKRALESMDLACDTAESAEEALAMLPEQPWDLALVDIRLPGRNGFSLASVLRGRDPALPVVILSQNDSALWRMRGALAGVHRYLGKPISMQQLRDTVAQGLTARAKALIEARVPELPGASDTGHGDAAPAAGVTQLSSTTSPPSCSAQAPLPTSDAPSGGQTPIGDSSQPTTSARSAIVATNL